MLSLWPSLPVLLHLTAEETMEASISSFISSSSITTTSPHKTRKTTMKRSNPKISPIHRIGNNSRLEGNGKLKWRVNVIEGGASVAADAGRGEVTWQIVVGAIAGVTPFVVAGIEFSKRIIAQRRCEVCGGSGLVLREKEYFRCPGCGGFLPWQSWRRFFSG